jgi:hypothetical protein
MELVCDQEPPKGVWLVNEACDTSCWNFSRNPKVSYSNFIHEVNSFIDKLFPTSLLKALWQKLQTSCEGGGDVEISIWNYNKQNIKQAC